MELHPSFFLGLHLRFVSLTLASPWVEAGISERPQRRSTTDRTSGGASFFSFVLGLDLPC
jgi:hypothetical protein